jgi:hypothetical protein
MTPSQTKLAKYLLKGYCLVKHYTFNRKVCYRLVNTAGVTVELLQCRTVEKLRSYTKPRQKLYKRDQFGRLTLNLKTVRQLHGRCTLKQLYKARHQLKEEKELIHKKRTVKKQQKPNGDDKAIYLF